MPSIQRFLGALIVLPALAASLLAQEPADATVRNVFAGLQEQRPQVLWQALPASYQRDLQGLIHDFAEQADAELWNLTFSLLGKSVRVLDEKREFVFDQPMISARLQEIDKPDQTYDAVLQLLSTLTSSELADIEKLRRLEPEAFLSGTVSTFLRQLRDLQDVLPGVSTPVDELDDSEVALVSSSGGSAVVRITNGGETEDRPFVLVEGKWVPEELAEEWDQNMAEARAQIAELAARQRAPETEQVVATMRSMEGLLDRMLAAQTREEFDDSMQQLVGTVMFQAMSLGAGQEEPEKD